MKKIFILSIFILVILFSGCNREDENIDNSSNEEKNSEIGNFEYKATVIGQGMDCGETFIISLEKIDSDTEFENGRYYADSLDANLKVEGLIIYLNCRESKADKLNVCTTFGPTYSHVVVTDSKIVED